jgi:peroxiredoxin
MRGNKWGKKEGSKTRIPADFLIDEEGILRHVYYGRHMDDHMPLDWIEDFLKV